MFPIIFQLLNGSIDLPKERNNIRYEELLGQILMNRVGGIVYERIAKCSDIAFPKNFCRSLEAVYLMNVAENEWYYTGVRYLTKVLSKADFKYAFLKGAVLIPSLYRKGQRISNDIDILVHANSLTQCQNLLKENGFVQGHYNWQTKQVRKADRREIIMAKMNFGETIPFYKEIDGKILCVDINFSVDFKPGDPRIIEILLDSVCEVSIGDISLKTLAHKYFFIHLCCHLYKEATTFDWVKTNRDLSLYKFYDIYLFVNKYFDKSFIGQVINCIKELGMEKECYYTMKNTIVIFPEMENSDVREFLAAICPDNLDFMHQIFIPSEKISYVYEQSFTEWFLTPNRGEIIERWIKERV